MSAQISIVAAGIDDLGQLRHLVELAESLDLVDAAVEVGLGNIIISAQLPTEGLPTVDPLPSTYSGSPTRRAATGFVSGDL